MSEISHGPRCGKCHQSEARCAYLGSCCPSCTHTFGECADHATPVVRPLTADDPRVVHLRALQQEAAENCLPDDLLDRALILVRAVRSRSPQAVDAVLAGADHRNLAVCLAALVPDGRSAVELLAWNDGVPGRARTARLRPCGTHAAFVRHRSNNEEPCGDCVTAERAYHRSRKRNSKHNGAPASASLGSMGTGKAS